METNINVLILEHDPNDIELLKYQLKKSGLNYSSLVVQTREAYEEALSGFRPDIILSDFSLPNFDGLSAFKIKQDMFPEIPFIIVSGTIGEENAVELIKMGVTDYALKEKLYQVIPKITRALNEAAERKQKELAERQLSQREKELQKIMDHSLDVICTFDEDGRFVKVGAASFYVWGYQPEELQGRKFEDFILEEDLELSRQAAVVVMNGEDVTDLENRYVRPDGTIVPMIWSARWDTDDNLMYAIARDATDIKKAEEKIRNNEKRFRTLLLNSTDGLALLAADGTVIERSPSALRILRLDESQASGPLRSDLIHPDDMAAINEACAQVIKDPNYIPTIEYRFRIPDGTYHWIETSLHNQLNEPVVEAIVLNFRDVTERKLAEIALEKSEEKYRNLFQSSPVPMWVYDSETYQFLDVNPAAIQNYGYTKEEFLSMTIMDIRPEEDLPDLEKRINSISGTETSSQTTARHKKKNGEIIYVEVQGNPLKLDSKNARVVLATDISERYKYTQAIEEQNIKLREIAWMQSHIVRAPLARLMGLVSLLSEYDTGTYSTKEIMALISSSAHELDDIIKGIVSKAEHVEGNLELEGEL